MGPLIGAIQSLSDPIRAVTSRRLLHYSFRYCIPVSRLEICRLAHVWRYGINPVTNHTCGEALDGWPQVLVLLLHAVRPRNWHYHVLQRPTLKPSPQPPVKSQRSTPQECLLNLPRASPPTPLIIANSIITYLIRSCEHVEGIARVCGAPPLWWQKFVSFAGH